MKRPWSQHTWVTRKSQEDCAAAQLCKNTIMDEEVRYLSHLISGAVLKPDPEKVSAIMRMQKPTDIKSMQLFIGFVNYLAKFLQNLLPICEELRKLSYKYVSWTWE